MDLHNLNTGTVLLSNAPVRKWGISYVLNSPGAFEADIALKDTTATRANWEPGQREIRVYRDGVLIWGGYLWSASVDVRDYSLRVRGEGYFSKLRRRYVLSDLVYNDVEQTTIAWNLIAHTQAQGSGDMLLTNGVSATSIVRDRDYCALEYPEVASAIMELSEMDDGFDLWITPTATDSTNKVVKTSAGTPYRRGTDVSGSVTLTQTSMATLQYDIDASDVASRVITVGQGDCNPHVYDDNDSTALTNFGLLMSVEGIEASKRVDVFAHGRETLRNYKVARWQMDVSFAEAIGPAWGAYDVGDVIGVTSNRGYATFTGQKMRVIERAHSFVPDNIMFTKLKLDSVVS